MSQTIKILFLGDIFGEVGRQIVVQHTAALRAQHQCDLVFANCENAAAGRGISSRLAAEILQAPIDFMTSGNHILRVHDIYSYLNLPTGKILRPCNLSRNAPGRGTTVVQTSSGVRVGLINIMGRIFMDTAVDLPFDAIDRALEDLQGKTDVMVLDIHAEATSEKRAMGWYLDGRVQLVVGTHTHVPTADEEILPKGTAYITDIGMCGPYDSVIGMDKDIILQRARTGIQQKFEPAKGDVRINAVVCEIDVEAKRAVSIKRVSLK